MPKERPLESYDFEYRHYKDLFFEQNKSKKGYAGLFEQAAELERQLGKDISEFTLMEIEILISLRRKKTVYQIKHVIEHYINFVNKLNNKVIDQNPASTKYIKNNYKFDTIRDWEEQFKHTDKYLTYNAINNIITKCREINPQDSLIIKLLFKGMHIHEICNFETTQVIENAINTNGRSIPIDNECLELINEAYNSTEYFTYEPSVTPRRNSQPFLPSGNRVIKKVDMNTKEDEKYQYGYISQRLVKIKKCFLINEKFTKYGIRHSGVIYKAKLLHESYSSRRDFLRTEDCNRLAEEFGTYTSPWVFELTKRENVRITYPDLEKTLPNNVSNPTIPSHSEKNFHKFWRVQEEYGEAGERIVRKKLESNGYTVKSQSPVIGYDFLAEREGEILHIEVKTTTSLKGTIYMSINELEVADRLGEEYLLFVVHLIDKLNEIGSIYMTEDPINVLQIDMGKIRKQLNNQIDPEITVLTHNIAIKLNLNFFEKICQKWPTTS